MHYVLLLILALVGCGRERIVLSPPSDYEEIKSKVQALTLIAESFDALVESDFASCSLIGDTEDPLINKICQVAQAATVEQQVAMQSSLQAFVDQLTGEIEAINNDLVGHQTNLVTLNAQVTSLLADVSSLDVRLTDVESSIDALENLTASISGVLGGVMESFSIGEENISAGPMYETLLRRVDKRRVNGYAVVYTTSLSLPNNPIDPTNGSPIVTITMTAHGYVAGDVVELSGLGEGSGFSSGDVYGLFTVTNVTINTLNITLPRNATSGTTFGGTVGVLRRYVGAGMMTLWKSGDLSDTVVRTTNLGSRRYNFIIRRVASDFSHDTAEVCWSTGNNAANFTTINSAPEGGDVSIPCY